MVKITNKKYILFYDYTLLFFYTSCHTEALKAVVEAAMAGVSVLSLCEKGDAYIAAETGKIFKKEKEMKKGQHVAAFDSSASRGFLCSRV